MKVPLISVLLPVYNGGQYLNEAIESILKQTYTNFELIIINDGSTDDSASIILSYDDCRIRYFEQKNIGLAGTLNRAILLSRGVYMARQDQDDVSYPTRFEKQVSFMELNLKCGMVGTWAMIREGVDNTDRFHLHPTDNDILKFDLIFNNPFVHSSIMIRKSVFEVVDGYSTDSERQPPEDYELWSRIARHFDVANIPEILLVYREAPNSMSRRGNNPFLENLVSISAENICWFMKIEPDDQRGTNLAALVHGAYHRLTVKVNPQQLTQQLLESTEHYSSILDVPQDVLLSRARVLCHSCLHNFRVHKYGRLYGFAIAISYKLKGMIL